MADEYIRLDTTIVAIDNLINEAATGTMARTLFKAKDMIYSQQRYFTDVQSANQWISVKDRLPEIGKSVLIYYPKWDGDEIQVAKLEVDGIMFDICGEFNIGTGAVTHWQPLPEPPKDGDKDNNVRNLTDEETEIYDSWLNSEARDTGVNIMDGDTNGLS